MVSCDSIGFMALSTWARNEWNTYIQLTKREAKMAGCWPKENEANIQPLLTEFASSIKDYMALKKMIFVLVYFRALRRRLVPMQKWWRVFGFFFGFSVPYRQRNHRKSRIIFYERKLSCSGLDFGEMLLREQNGHSRAGCIPPSCPLGLPIKVQALVLLARSRAELAI